MPEEAVDITQVAAQMMDASLLNTVRGLKGSQYKEVNEVTKAFDTPAEKPEDAPVLETEEVVVVPDAPVDTPADAPANEEDDDEPEITDSPLFTGKKKKYEIKNNEDFFKVLDKKYNAKDPESLAKFLQSTETWRASAQKLTEAEQRLAQVDELFKVMPQEMQVAMSAWGRGEDYKEAFIKVASQPDFTAPVEKQDKIKLIQYFYPNKFSEEDLKDFKDNPDDYPTIGGAYDFIKTSFYPQQKQIVERQRAEYDAKVKRELDNRNASVMGSVEQLEKAFPEIDKKIAKKTEQFLLNSDAQKILSFFMNEDGSYKKDAAEKLVMIEHGKTQILALKNLLKEQSKGMSAAVKRKPITPDSPASATDEGEIERKQMEAVVRSFTSKSPFD